MHPSPRPRHELNQAIFRPARALGLITGGALTAWPLVAGLILLSLTRDAEPSLKTVVAWAAVVVLLFLACCFAFWTYGLLTLRYVITEDALVITWGFRQTVIPLSQVQRMVPGRTLDEPHVQGLNWWGAHVGAAEVKRLGYTIFYSTHDRPDELLYVVTPQESYALSVHDQAAFAEEVQARAALASVSTSPIRVFTTGPAALPFWRDRVALVSLAISAAICALLAGYLASQYQSLPAVIQLEFPELGGIVRVGDKGELLKIAYLGLGILAANTVLGVLVHARERAAGLWLLASGGMVQAILLTAAVVAVRNA
ncbi:MAG: PH domain-containing protein [Tepidiformaceae bacterium]